MRGRSRVIAIDLDEDRLALAKSFGADETVIGRNVDVVQVLRELTDGQGVEMVVEKLGIRRRPQRQG